MKGKNNPFYGKKHSNGTKRKNSIAHIGQKAWNKGKTGIHSKETINKLRKIMLDKPIEKRPSWKGGRRKEKGYIFIYSPNHPNKTANNCVGEHRLVMEKHLKRFLTRKEVVHHINGKKDDNRLQNLKLFSNNSSHMFFHSKNGDIKGRPKKKR